MATLTILGYNSAIPTANGIPTAQFLEIGNQNFLIDCSEGTQVQLRRGKIKFGKINHIFISHLHGDHFFGLPGLVSSFRLLGRQVPLNIYGPKGIADAMEMMFRVSDTRQDFAVHYHELSSTESELIYEDEKLTVRTVPLNHRIYANGYLFQEKEGLRHLKMEEISKYPEISRCDYFRLKKGEDYVLSDGFVLRNEVLTEAATFPKSYAFVSDTRYKPDIVPIIHGADVLYHEATFLSNLQGMAEFTGHSTAREAATIARDAEVKSLILGHFSNRYGDLQVFLDEAQPIFPNTHLPKSLEPVIF